MIKCFSPSGSLKSMLPKTSQVASVCISSQWCRKTRQRDDRQVCFCLLFMMHTKSGAISNLARLQKRVQNHELFYDSHRTGSSVGLCESFADLQRPRNAFQLNFAEWVERRMLLRRCERGGAKGLI